jgi:hypothetical protein
MRDGARRGSLTEDHDKEVLPMSSTTVPAPAAALRARVPALSVRFWFVVLAPVLAGLFAILGAAADPAVGESGRSLYGKYAASPDALQWKSFGFHWAYAFWGITAFALAVVVRRRGVWLANLALLLAFVGATTLPGLLIIDFYDSAIGQVAGVDTTVAVNDAMEAMWGIKAIVVPGMIGFLLALPVAALAAWRAGIVRWWAVVAVVAGIVAFMGSGVAVWGTALTTVSFAVFAYALARSTELRRSLLS